MAGEAEELRMARTYAAELMAQSIWWRWPSG